MADWTQRKDEGGRMTYPPLPTRGGNPNAEATEDVVQGVASALSRTRQQEQEFRAQQHARRLKTRGAAAMREPAQEEGPSRPVDVPDDPLAQSYVAAGWL